ncbi:MAG TPA: RDD family protein [Candidatus Dormibacteraeota bacterium]|nr:RDD family protein [Candidatus Dormibacteraeota bacterium]
MLRRVLAVVVDFVVLYVVWVGVGLLVVRLSLPVTPGSGIPVYILAIDLPLTAAFGSSVGRCVAGIRVVRLSDGRAPGLPRAALRILLVLLTGPIALLYWTVAHDITYWLRTPLGPFRLWWDSAAGTAIVRSTRWGRAPKLTADEVETLRRAVGSPKPPN